MIDRSKILTFLKQNGSCVLATADKTGKPEAALMVYVVEDDFSFLMFTEPDTRKFKNIRENKRVSVVVGGWKSDPTVQIDGEISVLNRSQGSSAKEHVLSVHPEWKGYFDSSTGKWLRVKPAWLRYSDFSQEPLLIEELKSFQTGPLTVLFHEKK